MQDNSDKSYEYSSMENIMLINDKFDNIININQQVTELFGNITMLPEEDSFRQNITMNWCRQETEIVPQLLSLAEIDNKQRRRILNYAKSLVQLLRLNSNGKSSLVQNLLQEFSLSSTEGVALMCLAEALLRIPDQQTRDNLIKDKVRLGNWHVQRKNNSSIFVNAVTWGLVITGKLFSQKQVSSVQHTFRQVLTKASEPMIRKAVNVAMKMMGEQFVMGERIEQALNQADKEINKKFRYS